MIRTDAPCRAEPRTWGPARPALRAAAMLAIGCLLLAACGDGAVERGGEATQRPVAPTDAVRPELQRLVGTWVRPDGGYVLEIHGVAPDGAVDAAYFNPRPIRISLARADWFDGTPWLVVEFDDVNYRGSTYQLEHVADRDLLHGTYYQAEMQQTFEVVFARRP